MTKQDAISRIRFLLDVGGSDGFTSADKEALNMAINSLTAEFSEPPKTNADRIRQMTDKELVRVLSGQCSCCEHQYENCGTDFSLCDRGVLEWLKKEVSEDVTD